MTATQICSECCHPRPDRHKVRCTAQLAELHQTIDERWKELQLLGARKLKTTGLGEGSAPGFESTELINLTTYAHLDPQSKWWKVGPEDIDRPTLGIWAVLDYWRSKAGAVGGSHLDFRWVVHQPWIGDMVADLRTLAAQVLSATGDPPPRPVGTCTRVVGIVEREIVYCCEPLYMPDTGELRGRDESIRGLPDIKCPNPDCGEIYRGADLIRLKLAYEHDRRRPPSDLLSSAEGTCTPVGQVDTIPTAYAHLARIEAR